MKFDYGDDVIFRGIEGLEATVEKRGAVVGITEVQSDKQAEALGYPIGAILYTVEFGDGSDQLALEDRLTSLNQR